MKKIVRDTNTDLMNHVLELVKQSGDYEKAGEIMDYFLAENYEVKELTNYEFDFLAVAKFGGSEGIYLDCWLQGSFDENHRDKIQTIPCGTFKTLRDDLEAMKVMGELAGSLTYHESQYVNRELDRYSPFKERLFSEYQREICRDKKGEGSLPAEAYKTNAVCPQCGGMLTTGTDYKYSFMCPHCKEHLLDSEVKIPGSGMVIMKVPVHRKLNTTPFLTAFQTICKENQCNVLLSGGSVLDISWDHVPAAEKIRKVVIGLAIYMDGYKG